MRVAAVQLTSGPDKATNFEKADGFVAAAAKDGAELVVLPELWNAFGDTDVIRSGAEPLVGTTTEWAKTIAAREGIWLLNGSITESIPGSDLVYNTSTLISPEGELAAVYRKVHLCDIDAPGARYCESDTTRGGDEFVTTDVGDINVGLAICYDIRFPEIFRSLALAGAQVVALPTAFLLMSGRDHYETLARARAIENVSFFIGADQWGSPPGSGVSFLGRSMIIDPWGTVLATAPDKETYIVADLDVAMQAQLRQHLTNLAHTRPDVYTKPVRHERAHRV